MMTANLDIRVLFALVALCFGIVAAAPARAFEVKSVTSPGGITAWLVEDHSIPLIALSFSFAGGAAGDPEGKAGLAHFLSGMLDEGAGDLDSQAFHALLDSKAIKFAFEAERDEFSGTVQTLSKNRDEAFRLLKLALNQPRFDPDPLERIRGQILLGIREDSEDPEDIASDAWMKTVFGSHPYGRPTKGSEEGIKAVGSADLKQLTQRLFSRDGLMIAVVGDIDEDTLKRLLDDTFGALPASSGMPKVPETEPLKGPHVEVIKRDIPQSIIRFGLKGIKRDDVDYIPAYVMNFILGDSSFGSRLNEEVREKRGLSYSVYSSLYPLNHAGLVVGGAATVNERAAETIDILRRELKRMAADGPTETELKEAKTYLTGSYALRFDSNRKIANQLLAIQRDKLGINYIERRNGLVEAVTLADLKRVARRLLDGDGLVFTVVGKPRDVVATGKSG